MPIDKLNYSPETRAIEMASKDMEKVIEKVSSMRPIPFLKKRTGERTQAIKDLIANASPEVRALLTEGFNQDTVARLAREEQNHGSE